MAGSISRAVFESTTGIEATDVARFAARPDLRLSEQVEASEASAGYPCCGARRRGHEYGGVERQVSTWLKECTAGRVSQGRIAQRWREVAD